MFTKIPKPEVRNFGIQRSKFRRGLALVAFIVVALSACDNAANLTAEEYLLRAREFQVAGDLRSSIIELKNALQKNPDSSAARFLLGGIYLEIGEAEAAEKELLRAISLGMGRTSVALSLGRAWLMQGKFQNVLEEISFESGDSNSYKASVLALLGDAYRGLRMPGEAEKSFRAALEVDANSHVARVGLARAYKDLGDLIQAEAYLRQALEIAPQDFHVRSLQGDLAFARGDHEDSERIYAALLAENPNYHVARMGLALAQIGAQKYDNAKNNLAALLKVSPNHAYTNFLRALAAYLDGEYEDAKTFGDKVFRQESAHLPTLLVAGAASFALEQFEQAANYLLQFVDQVPDHMTARKLLGGTLLRLGQSRQAFTILEPLADKDTGDAELLTMVGAAAVRSGDIANAGRYLRSAVALRPHDAAPLLQLGTIRMALGETEEGLTDIERAITLEPGKEANEIAYIGILLRAKEFERALTAARQLEARQPASPIGATLAGQALTGLKDFAGAEAAFRKALTIDPGFFEATHYLAVMALGHGQPDRARSLYHGLLKHKPKHLNALLSLAQLETIEKNHAEAGRLLEIVVQDNPDNATLRILVAQAHLRTGAPLKALSATNQILEKFPRNPSLLEVTGKAQLAAGQVDAALATFESLIRLQSQSAAARHMKATALEARGDWNGVEQAIQEALARAPDYLPARILETRALGRKQDTDAARKLIADLAVEHPDHPEVIELQGNLALQQGKFDVAIEHFKRAQQADATSGAAVKLSLSQWRSGDRQAAWATLEQWLTDFPSDVAVRLQLASTYEETGRFEDARQHYETVIRQMPGHWIARNDLAWTLMKMKKLDEALDHAELAHTASSSDPAVADTLGLILLRLGENSRAERLLREAADGMPEDQNVRYHLALALSRAGKQEESQDLLKKILASDQPFPERAAAQALLEGAGR
ncbi:MAG: XrtA/PEP-CTERM system TPR-repeat protein PrsT [Sphingomonadales bacterium]